MIYLAIDEAGEVATISPVKHFRRSGRKWCLLWTSGRAPEYFEYLSDAKRFVEVLRHSHAIVWSQWHRNEFEEAHNAANL